MLCDSPESLNAEVIGRACCHPPSHHPTPELEHCTHQLLFPHGPLQLFESSLEWNHLVYRIAVLQVDRLLLVFPADSSSFYKKWTWRASAASGSRRLALNRQLAVQHDPCVTALNAVHFHGVLATLAPTSAATLGLGLPAIKVPEQCATAKPVCLSIRGRHDQAAYGPTCQWLLSAANPVTSHSQPGGPRLRALAPPASSRRPL